MEKINYLIKRLVLACVAVSIIIACEPDTTNNSAKTDNNGDNAAKCESVKLTADNLKGKTYYDIYHYSNCDDAGNLTGAINTDHAKIVFSADGNEMTQTVDNGTPSVFPLGYLDGGRLHFQEFTNTGSFNAWKTVGENDKYLSICAKYYKSAEARDASVLDKACDCEAGATDSVSAVRFYFEEVDESVWPEWDRTTGGENALSPDASESCE